MVSTRSVKYKFSEGEKVLCYEPDPAKTKVLYNSKVLDICSKKDETGKKVVQFLIHFQGWNSTWDRFVTEEYVLKDTEENRQLQKELSRLVIVSNQLKIYQLKAMPLNGYQACKFCSFLPSRNQSRTGCFRGGNLYKRDRKKRTHKLTDRGEGGEAKRGPSVGSASSLVAPPPPHSDSDASDHDESLPLALSNPLKSILELDFQLVTHQNKVLNLPAEPNAVSILEMFLKEYATSQMRLACNRKSHLRAPASSHSQNSITLEGFCRNMNLCREVVDGLRVYMDFMLEKVLLYKQERGQHHQAMTIGIQREPIKIKEELDDGSPKKSMFNTAIKEENVDSDDVMVVEVDRRRSLRSHTNTSTESNLQNGGRISNKTYSGNGEIASTSRADHSSKGEMAPRLMTPREQEVLNRILSWSLLPERVRTTQPPQASLVYGATHLARLFVKLPELLQHSNHSEAKTNLLIDYLCNFMKYLEDHPEWFGEEHYRDNNYPPPPNPEPSSSTAVE